jgi:hypothetical protein
MRFDQLIRQIPELWKIDRQFRFSLEAAVIGFILLLFCSTTGTGSRTSGGNYRPSSIPSGPTPPLTQQNINNVQQQTGTPVVPLGPVAPLSVTPFTTLDKTKLPKPPDDNSDRMDDTSK